MGLSERLRAFAFGRPHVFVVPLPGGTAQRLAVERVTRERGWPLVVTPRDADILAVCGPGEGSLGAPLAHLRSQVPAPVALARLGTEGPAPADAEEVLGHDVTEVLDRAARQLLDVGLQRRRAEAGAHPAGAQAAEMGEDGMVAAGLPTAETRPDRDGLELDALTVPLGPFLIAWPAGLTCTLVLQGDVVQEASVDAAPAPAGVDAFWDAPWLRSLRGGQVTVAEAETRRAAALLDALARLLVVVGFDEPALASVRLRDAALEGTGDADGIAALRRRLERSRILARQTAGYGTLDAEALTAAGVTGPALRAAGVAQDLRTHSPSYAGFEPCVLENARGDVATRWRQWLAEAEAALRLAATSEAALEPVDGGHEGPRGRLATGPSATSPSGSLRAVLPAALAGQDLAIARMVVASLDPDGDEVADVGASEPTGAASGPLRAHV